MNDYISLYNLYYQNREEYEEKYLSRYQSESSIHYDFLIGKNPAFMFLHPNHYSLVVEIEKLDKDLFALSNLLPDIAKDHFIKNTLISEIQNTNDIEGVISTRKEISEILAQMELRHGDRLFGMVNRYRFLMDKKKVPLSTPNDIRTIYDELVSQEIQESDPNDQLDGTLFRQKTVYLFRASGKKLHEGVNPESEIIDMLSRAMTYLHELKLPALVRIALFHYLFGYIHPFYNGNGRVNRFISSYLLSEEYTSIIAYRLSQQIKQERKLYYEAFEKANSDKNKGDIGTFVMMFLSIVRDAFQSTLNELDERYSRLRHYSKKIDQSMFANSKIGNILYIIVQCSLFAEEGLKIEEIANYANQSEVWTRGKIKDLMRYNYIQKSKQGYFYLYQANLSKLDEISFSGSSNV